MKAVLKLVQVARSTYYYWRSSKYNDKDEKIVSMIREVLSGECSCYRYKKVTALVKVRYKIKINKKKVYRLMQKNGLLKPRYRKYAHRRRIDDRKVERPNQMWPTHIKYEYIAGSDRTFYVVN